MNALFKTWRNGILEAKRSAKEQGRISGDEDLAQDVSDILEAQGLPRVKRAAMNHWFTGRNPPSVIQFVALCQALSVAPSDALLGGPALQKGNISRLPALSSIKSEVVDLMEQTTDRGRSEIALFARQTVERYPANQSKQAQ